MKCDKCGSESGIYESRPTGGNRTRRGHRCEGCGNRWTTYEITKSEYEALCRDKDRLAGIVQALFPYIKSGETK